MLLDDRILRSVVKRYYARIWPFAWLFKKPGLIREIESYTETLNPIQYYFLLKVSFSSPLLLSEEDKPIAKLIRKHAPFHVKKILKFIFRKCVVYQPASALCEKVLQADEDRQHELSLLIDQLSKENQTVKMVDNLLSCMNQGISFDDLRPLGHKNLLTPVTLELLLQYPTKRSLVRAFSNAAAFNFPVQDLYDLARTEYPDDLVHVYNEMYNANFAMYKNIIRQHKAPNAMFQALKELSPDMLSDKLNIDLLSNCNDPREMARALRILSNGKLLDRKTQHYLLDKLKVTDGHFTYDNSVVGLLINGNRYNTNNYKLAMNHPNPEWFAQALTVVEQKHLEKSIPDIFKFEECHYFARCINDLYRFKLYTKETIDFLLENQKKIAALPSVIDVLKQKSIPPTLLLLKTILLTEYPYVFAGLVVQLNERCLDTPENLNILAVAENPANFLPILIGLNEQTDFQRLQPLLKNNLLAHKQKTKNEKVVHNSNLFLFNASHPVPSTTLTRRQSFSL